MFVKSVLRRYRIVARTMQKLLDTPTFTVTIEEGTPRGTVVNKKSLKTTKWSQEPDLKIKYQDEEFVPLDIKQQMSMLVGPQATMR